MLSNYIEQLFKLDNYYDGLIVTDNKGYAFSLSAKVISFPPSIL